MGSLAGGSRTTRSGIDCRTSWSRAPGARRSIWRAAAEAVRRIGATWVWAAVSETSTGMLNDLRPFGHSRDEHRVALCLDCVSAIGAVPLDLSGAYLATGASGKALAALPGLSFVFYNHDLAPAPDRLPRYLDLGAYAAAAGVPFTQSSNLVAALDAALDRFDRDAPFDDLDRLARSVRPKLRAIGWAPLVDEAQATPAVFTIALQNGFRAAAIGEDLARQGLLVAHHSDYLARRNWFQISLMGHRSPEPVECLVAALARIARHESHARPAGH